MGGGTGRDWRHIPSQSFMRGVSDHIFLVAANSDVSDSSINEEATWPSQLIYPAIASELRMSECLCPLHAQLFNLDSDLGEVSETETLHGNEGDTWTQSTPQAIKRSMS